MPAPLQVLNLFSGIGGFELGIQLACDRLNLPYGIVGLCEKDTYCREVLGVRFPGVPIFDDATSLTRQSLQAARITHVDILTASPPCQPFSKASSKRKGSADDRNLFPHVIRLMEEIEPKLVIIENVQGLLSVQKGEYFKDILNQIAQVGYDAIWQTISCAQLQGVHRRNRLFIVAYPNKGTKIPSQKNFTTQRSEAFFLQS